MKNPIHSETKNPAGRAAANSVHSKGVALKPDEDREEIQEKGEPKGETTSKAVVSRAQEGSDEVNQITEAHDTAARMVQWASIKAEEEDIVLYNRWFDASYTDEEWATSGRLEKVKEGWRQIDSIMQSHDVEYDLHNREGDSFAWVYTRDNRYRIFPESRFWSASLTGFDSRAGTIVHEMTHEVLDLDDHAYGKENAMDFAENDPVTAIDNADNWEYFAEDTF